MRKEGLLRVLEDVKQDGSFSGHLALAKDKRTGSAKHS